jgi:hypothetical protein
MLDSWRFRRRVMKAKIGLKESELKFVLRFININKINNKDDIINQLVASAQ